MTQIKFAEKCGISSRTLVDWENGRSLPNQAALDAIVRSTGCSALWLLTGEGPILDDKSKCSKPKLLPIVCAETACSIGGVCYADGSASPDSPCAVCDIGVSASDWTALAYGVECNDGNACTENDACDGQGACVGSEIEDCGADGDYDADIDPDEVVIGEECPDVGLRICLYQWIVTCDWRNIWVSTADCIPEGKYCVEGECLTKDDPDYPGCSKEQTDRYCVGDVLYGCLYATNDWGVVFDCSDDGDLCLQGACVNQTSAK